MKTRKTMNSMKGKTNSELARELQCPPGSVTRICRSLGIKPNGGGLLDREAVLQEIASRTSGYGAGWSAAGREKPSLAERAEALLNAGKPHEAVLSEAGEVLNAYHRGMADLARILRDACRVESLTDIAVEIGTTPEHALHLARTFIYVVNGWVRDLLAEVNGKQYGEVFDKGIQSWLASLVKADAKTNAAQKAGAVK
jgi:hypothetical protein